MLSSDASSYGQPGMRRSVGMVVYGCAWSVSIEAGAGYHINVEEVFAFFLTALVAISLHEDTPRPLHLPFAVDSTVAAAWAGHTLSDDPNVGRWMRTLHRVLASKRVQVSVHWVPREQNFLADAPSKGDEASYWAGLSRFRAEFGVDPASGSPVDLASSFVRVGAAAYTAVLGRLREASPNILAPSVAGVTALLSDLRLAWCTSHALTRGARV